jgi:hypothetical protein
MKNNERPDDFFDRLIALQVQHNGDLSDEQQLIKETMQKAPKKYHSTIANETRNQGNN